MGGKLLIARYENRIIHISQYKETEHHEKLLCPFCNPPIKVTYNIKGHGEIKVYTIAGVL